MINLFWSTVPEIQWSNTFLAMVWDFWFLGRNNSGHLVKWSTESSMGIPQYPSLLFPQGDNWWLVAALLVGNGCFLLWHGNKFRCPFKFMSRDKRPEKPLLVPRRSLGSAKMAQVIEQHLKNSRSKISGNNYLSWARVLNVTTLKDTVLPHTQVGPLLNKNSAVQVVHTSWRGSFRNQQRLYQESVGQLSFCCLTKSRDHASCATAITPWTLLKVSATAFLFRVPAMWWTLHSNSLNLSTHLHNRPLCSLVRVGSHLRDSW